MEENHKTSEFDLELPVELGRALSDSNGRWVQVPAYLDRMILSAAHVRLARRKRAVRVLRWGSAVAAAIALFAVARFTLVNHSAPLQVAVIGDVNADGHVNILDAYVVAKAIASHEKLSPAWDVNGDGVVDQKDVDLIAQMAVDVGKGAMR